MHGRRRNIESQPEDGRPEWLRDSRWAVGERAREHHRPRANLARQACRARAVVQFVLPRLQAQPNRAAQIYTLENVRVDQLLREKKVREQVRVSHH